MRVTFTLSRVYLGWVRRRGRDSSFLEHRVVNSCRARLRSLIRLGFGMSDLVRFFLSLRVSCELLLHQELLQLKFSLTFKLFVFFCAQYGLAILL